jgi:hypothetical protein
MPDRSAPMLFGLRVVMLGRQGSGKGTQGTQLARLLVVPHVSVGDVLREAVLSGSPAGLRAQLTMERGDLVDDELVVSLVAERLAAADVRSGGFVLDGFPRTVDQAEALAGMLADQMLDRAVVIDVPLEVAETGCWPGGCAQAVAASTAWPGPADSRPGPAERAAPKCAVVPTTPRRPSLAG